MFARRAAPSPIPTSPGVLRSCSEASGQLQPSSAFRAFTRRPRGCGANRAGAGRRWAAGPLRPRSARRAAPWYWRLSGKAGCRPAPASLPTRPPGFASRRGSDLRMASRAWGGGGERRPQRKWVKGRLAAKPSSRSPTLRSSPRSRFVHMSPPSFSGGDNQSQPVLPAPRSQWGEDGGRPGRRGRRAVRRAG